jgi:hypothetical protein
MRQQHQPCFLQQETEPQHPSNLLQQQRDSEKNRIRLEPGILQLSCRQQPQQQQQQPQQQQEQQLQQQQRSLKQQQQRQDDRFCVEPCDTPLRQEQGLRGTDDSSSVESRALQLVSRLQQPLEFSAHLEAEIRARACRAPPILLASSFHTNNNTPLEPPQRQERQNFRAEQQQQVLICPANLAVQNTMPVVTQSDGVSLNLIGRRPSQTASLLIIGNDTAEESNPVHQPCTTFRFYYQLTNKGEVKTDGKTDIRP